VIKFGGPISRRLAYQCALFANATVIYGLIAKTFPSAEILTFSLFLGAIALFVNLGMQLPHGNRRWLNIGIRLPPIIIMATTVLYSHIVFSLPVIVLALIIVIFIKQETLLATPRTSQITVALVPPIISFTRLVYVKYWHFSRTPVGFWLVLLMLPYVLLILLDIGYSYEENPITLNRMSGSIWSTIIIIFGQVVPVLSGAFLVSLASNLSEPRKIGMYVIFERSLAIGGSLTYLGARILPLEKIKRIIWLIGSAVSIGFIIELGHDLGLFAVPVPFAAGVYLSSATILLNRSGRVWAVFNANALALISLIMFCVLARSEILEPRFLFSIYIIPQLVLLLPSTYLLRKVQ